MQLLGPNRSDISRFRSAHFLLIPEELSCRSCFEQSSVCVCVVVYDRWLRPGAARFTGPSNACQESLLESVQTPILLGGRQASVHKCRHGSLCPCNFFPVTNILRFRAFVCDSNTLQSSTGSIHPFGFIPLLFISSLHIQALLVFQPPSHPAVFFLRPPLYPPDFPC